MTLDEIIEQVIQRQATLVEITGGEPLLQKACGMLAGRLLEQRFTVLCETSGTLPIDRLPPGVIRIMDLKCPSSGESQRIAWTNIALLSPRDEVKFVVGDRADFDWVLEIVRQHRLDQLCPLLVSPVFGKIEPRELACWVLEEKLPARLQLQLHKYIWPSDAHGV